MKYLPWQQHNFAMNDILRETKGAGSFTDKQGCSKFSAQELLRVAIFGREFYEYKYSRALQHFLNGIEEPCLEFVF